MRRTVFLTILCTLTIVGYATADEPRADLAAIEDAVAAFSDDRREAAVATVDSLAALYPDDTRLHSVLGQFHWYRGDRNASRASFARTLELDPTHTEARIYLKRIDFVPAGWQPPTLLITDSFVVRPITAADTESDFAAHQSSVEHLQGVFGPGVEWPQGVTPKENREVLAWHEQEYDERTGFVFTVRSRFGDRCLGCVYVYPCRRDDFHAESVMWVTAEAAERGMDEKLEKDVRFWLKTDWPLESVIYPGRDMSWEEYFADEG